MGRGGGGGEVRTNVRCRGGQRGCLQRAEQSRAELSRAELSRAELSRAELSRAEQSRAEQSRAEQSRAEQYSTRRNRSTLLPILPRVHLARRSLRSLSHTPDTHRNREPSNPFQVCRAQPDSVQLSGLELLLLDDALHGLTKSPGRGNAHALDLFSPLLRRGVAFPQLVIARGPFQRDSRLLLLLLGLVKVESALDVDELALLPHELGKGRHDRRSCCACFGLRCSTRGEGGAWP